jgi:hypothetical protein
MCADGEVLHAFQHLRLHENRGYSSAPYRVSEAVHPGMLADVRKFVRALDYTGVLMLEFRLNRAADEWLFHDFNARFWAALPLTVAAGADYPYWLYQAVVEASLPAGVSHRHLVPELAARSPVTQGEPRLAVRGAHTATRDRAGSLAIRDLTRVERHAGAGRSPAGADRPRPHRRAAGPNLGRARLLRPSPR